MFRYAFYIVLVILLVAATLYASVTALIGGFVGGFGGVALLAGSIAILATLYVGSYKYVFNACDYCDE